MAIAAIDQGTSSTRVLVGEADGHLRVAYQIEHRQFYPHAGFVEHDGSELIANVRRCLEAAGPVEAIGLANQGESCLAWDRDTGEPISPVLVWQDSRTAEFLAALKRDGGEDLTLARARLPLDPYFSGSKLRWILDHVPAARDRLRAGRLGLGTTDAFFLQHLTGRYVTDATTASRTSLMNLADGEWDPELCRLFGVPIEALPQIVSTVGDFGATQSAPVTASAVDQQAALWGHGCRRPGDAKVTFGTGAFALAIAGERPPEARDGLLPTVAWQINGRRTYAVDAGVYSAGSAVDWLTRLGLYPDHALVFDKPPAIDRDLVFVPALAGLACPHWDRTAAGLWLGLSLDTTREDMAQALLEGIALATSEALAAMGVAASSEAPLSIDGGLTRNAYFVEFLASSLARPVSVQTFAEMTAFGALLLAATGVGRPSHRHGLETRVVAPRWPASGWRERFAEAIGRSRLWRRSGRNA
jgi:glycerol kinase